MHKAITSTETMTYVHCPSCGARAGRIDHLFGDGRRVDTRWSCGECGNGYKLTVDGPGSVQVEIDNSQGVNVPCLHVLVLEPRSTPVYAIIKAIDYGRGCGDKEPFDGAEYFYDEHTCPTNWTGDIEMLVADGDGDPHGLFRYVESIDLPPGVDDVDAFIETSLPHLFGGQLKIATVK